MRIVGGETAVREYDIKPQIWRVVGEQLDVLGSRESRGLAGGREGVRPDAPGRCGVTGKARRVSFPMAAA